MEHDKVQDFLGPPIKAFGEESRRGRRERIYNVKYVDKDGRNGIRLQFYLQGRRNKATCQLDARYIVERHWNISLISTLYGIKIRVIFREDSSGKMQTRFLIVSVEDLLRNVVIVHDNR